jgi:cell division protein ZapA
MSHEANAVKIKILDKEYLVSCPEDEQDVLLASAKHLNEKMLAIRSGGKVVGVDRIAVMAGLNIAHEAIESGVVGGNRAQSVAARLNKLNERIDAALTEYRKPGLN